MHGKTIMKQWYGENCSVNERNMEDAQIYLKYIFNNVIMPDLLYRFKLYSYYKGNLRMFR